MPITPFAIIAKGVIGIALFLGKIIVGIDPGKVPHQAVVLDEFWDIDIIK